MTRPASSDGGVSGTRVRPARAGHGGRRPGTSGARGAILEAARHEFATSGYDAATIRAIAARAEVDPALVHHYFGTKEALFLAALELPVRPGEIFAHGMATGPDQLGATVVRSFLTAWEPPENRVRLVAMLRCATTNDAAMGLMRELLARDVFGPITTALGLPDASLRANLVGTQLIGLAVMRYLGRVEPIASATVDELTVMVGPTVQRYLTGKLG